MSRFLKSQYKSINHFSIRKLTIGVASVLLSTTLYFGLNMEGQLNAQAAEINQEIEETPSDNASKLISNNSKSKTKFQKEEVSQQDQVNQKAASSTESIENRSSNFDKTENKESSTVKDIGNTKSTSITKNSLKATFKEDKSTSTPTVKTIYPESNKNSVPQNSWFNVQVSSGTLTNVRKGTTYQVKIGNSNLMNYDPDPINVPEFNVTNYGNGVFDVEANKNYTKASFTISASMQYKKQIDKDENILIPVKISKDGEDVYDTSTNVNITPTPQPTYEETHPLLKYKCYGKIPGTDKIAWGVYINYSGEELKDLDVSATFKNQTLIVKSIMAYTPTVDEIRNEGTNQDSYPDETYNYMISEEVQKQSGIDPISQLQFKQKGALIVDNKNYSKRPIYIYFQTQLGNNGEVPTSTFTLNAAGVPTTSDTANPSSNGNNGSSNGSYEPIKVFDKRTVNETINYLYKDSNKVAAPQYQATPITFTREGEKDAVTGEIRWGKWSADQSFKEVTSPVIKGYTADKASIAAQEVSADSKDLIFNVYYSKDAPTKVSESRTVNETINYLYKDSNKIAAPQYQATPITFTREGEKDAVTGEISWGKWSADQSFKEVTSPVIKGYTADKASIAAQEVSTDSKDLVFNVYYSKDPEPIIPTEPQEPHNPIVPETPSDNTPQIEKISKTKPIKPEEKKDKKQIQIIKPKASHIEKYRRGFSNRNIKNNKINLGGQFTHFGQMNKIMDKNQKQSKLPQTGSESTLITSLLGGVSVMLGLFGLGIRRRK